ncbi:MAG: WbqC family protein [Pseudomonadota bacterium]|nr:WbqC family protein [Pseudomonadota bacterium]
MTCIAVIQPYFVPYAGYFRLFAAADKVVLYDCVQFPRRGRVHRNVLPDSNSNRQWLTLPLQKANVKVKIRDLSFAEDAKEAMIQRTSRFPSLSTAPCELMSLIHRPVGSVVDYLESTLKVTCKLLGLPCNTTRSSLLELPPQLSGTQRIIAVANSLGADTYVNLSGGRNLYNKSTFLKQGIKLKFLNEWQGSKWSILQHLALEERALIAKDIWAQC